MNECVSIITVVRNGGPDVVISPLPFDTSFWLLTNIVNHCVIDCVLVSSDLVQTGPGGITIVIKCV